VTSQNAIRAAATRALQAPPALCACTISTRSAEFDPFPAEGPQLAHQGAVVGRDQRPRTGLQQGKRHIDGGAGIGLFVQSRHDLQYGGAGERAPRNPYPLEVGAHGGASFWQLGADALRAQAPGAQARMEFIDALAFGDSLRRKAATMVHSGRLRGHAWGADDCWTKIWRPIRW
jgi:hypothetical protein